MLSLPARPYEKRGNRPPAGMRIHHLQKGGDCICVRCMQYQQDAEKVRNLMIPVIASDQDDETSFQRSAGSFNVPSKVCTSVPSHSVRTEIFFRSSIAAEDLGSVIVSTPLPKLADTLSASTRRGRGIDRLKYP